MYSIYVCSIRGGACVLNLYVCSIRAMSGLGVLHLCVLNLYLYLYLYEWTIRRGNLANTNPTQSILRAGATLQQVCQSAPFPRTLLSRIPRTRTSIHTSRHNIMGEACKKI